MVLRVSCAHQQRKGPSLLLLREFIVMLACLFVLNLEHCLYLSQLLPDSVKLFGCGISFSVQPLNIVVDQVHIYLQRLTLAALESYACML